jgi:hypothetical protein
MSIQAMNWAYAVANLPMAQKFALVTLANYADDFGVCWPEQETLKNDCACSARTIRDALAALQQAGLIARKLRRRRDGSRRSDVYLLVGFAARKPIVGAEHHPILTADDVAEMVESVDSNRQNLPVDTPDQPAESAKPTGKICTTNRQNLPVTIRQEPPEEPSREPSEEEGAQARAGKSDFSKADGTDASGTPPASGLSGLLRRVLVAVNHDPDSDLPHWWTGPGALTSMERWRAFGLSDDQIVACAADTRKDNATPPEGPKALDRAMQRFADSLRKRVGKPAIMTPEQERAARLENLKWWAKNIEERPSLAASNIKLGLADELLTEGLTTPQALRRACVPFRIGPGTVCARLFPEYQP